LLALPDFTGSDFTVECVKSFEAELKTSKILVLQEEIRALREEEKRPRGNYAAASLS
jgi:hypothetical protein